MTLQILRLPMPKNTTLHWQAVAWADGKKRSSVDTPTCNPRFLPANTRQLSRPQHKTHFPRGSKPRRPALPIIWRNCSEERNR